MAGAAATGPAARRFELQAGMARVTLRAGTARP